MWGSVLSAVHLPCHIKEYERIVVFEMINILIALRIWGDSWTDKRITIQCDNHVVVDVINT